jgi:hypothetical protein
VFWGIGRDRQGRNELGKALMRLREQLRRECARCLPKLQSPSVPIKPSEPAPDANVGMYSIVCCTDGVLMSPTISNSAIAILTLALARSNTCHWMQTSYMHHCTCMYNHDQLIMYAPHSSLRFYLSLYSKCKVGSPPALIADRSGTPTRHLSRSVHFSLAPVDIHLDASTLRFRQSKI